LNLGAFRRAVHARPPAGGLPVRREWIIQVPAPVEEPPLQLPKPEPGQEPAPVPEETPA